MKKNYAICTRCVCCVLVCSFCLLFYKFAVWQLIQVPLKFNTKSPNSTEPNERIQLQQHALSHWHKSNAISALNSIIVIFFFNSLQNHQIAIRKSLTLMKKQQHISASPNGGKMKCIKHNQFDDDKNSCIVIHLRSLSLFLPFYLDDCCCFVENEILI